ncbi:cytochrome P450 [Mycena epipterygia]|nr:cytochrome P450 [Mycena epipterygia]
MFTLTFLAISAIAPLSPLPLSASDVPEFRPITYFRLLTEDVVVLNTREAAFKSLEKRSAIYTDRLHQIMCGELMSWNRGIALCPAGQRHRTYRRLVNGTLSASASKLLWGVQERAVHNFAGQLLRQCVAHSPGEIFKPDYRFLDILRRSTVGLNVVGIIFDSEPAQDNKSDGMTEEDMVTYIDQADHAHALFAQALAPFVYMVDWIPMLKHVPAFATFKRDAKRAREDLEELTMFPYLKLTRSRITIAVVTTLFLTAALHSAGQALAQSEIDEIVGHNRMPGFEDRESLSSASAVPVAHIAMKSDTIEGYYIPKGTTVIANICTFPGECSTTLYKAPSRFDPSRFLPRTGTPNNPGISDRCELDIGSLAFGFGRRICPVYISSASFLLRLTGIGPGDAPDSGIWIYAASVLWEFDIKVKDYRDNNVNNASLSRRWEEFQFSDGAIMYPLPFGVCLRPRSSEIENVLKKDFF